MRTLPAIGLRRRKQSLLTIVFSLALGCLLALLPLQPSAAIPVSSVTNPQQANGTWVSDMADMLSPASEAELNRIITDLEATNGTELAVVTVPDTQPSASPKAFATELFSAWGIGKEGADNGVLFLVSKGDRRTEVETGYAVEGALSDAKVGNILDTRVTPQFKSGNFDAGILAGTQAMVSSLKGEAFEVSQPSRAPVAAVRTANPMAGLYSKIFGFFSAAGLFFLSSRLAKIFIGNFTAVTLEPMGRSQVSKLKANAELDLDVMSLLIGKPMAKEKGLTYKRSEMLSHYNDPVVEESWLVSSHQRSQLANAGWITFGWLLAFAGLLGLVLQEGVVVEPIFTFVWLCCELWFYRQDLQHRDALKADVTTAVVIRLAFISTIGFLIGFMMNHWLGGWIAWPVLAAFFGFCAVMMRLARSLPDQPKALCEDCHQPMRRLSSKELSEHTSKPDKVELKLGSKQYEGWQCETCSASAKADDGLSIHLADHVLNKKGYSLCTACDALTLETATKVLKHSTSLKKGKKTVMKLCHCCGGHSKKTFTMPKIEPKLTRSSSSSSSSSSSYSSSRSSSSRSSSSRSSSSRSSSSRSSSSRSSSRSSGSFGGGSSGGGGAGSSW